VSNLPDHPTAQDGDQEEELMLEDSLFSSRPSDRSKKPTTLLLSAFVHGTLASAVIVIPLFQNQVLPQVRLLSRCIRRSSPGRRSGAGSQRARGSAIQGLPTTCCVDRSSRDSHVDCEDYSAVDIQSHWICAQTRPPARYSGRRPER
jgi:hypothetical protein